MENLEEAATTRPVRLSESDPRRRIVQELVDRLEQDPTQGPIPAWLLSLRDLEKRMHDAIKPGPYLIGTEEEELEYARQNELNEEINAQRVEATPESLPAHMIRVNEDVIHVQDYVGNPPRDKYIRHLHSVAPLQVPKNIAYAPMEHQLKAAAQAIFSCNAPHEGVLIGHPSGMGKTLIAILCMNELRHEPGPTVVVCPAAICSKWVEEIQGAFKSESKLTAIHLNDHNTSAADLMRGGYDVIVCSFEFLQQSHWKLTSLKSQFDSYRKKKDFNAPTPQLPTLALYTDVWERYGLGFNLLVIDEAQHVKRREDAKHQASVAIKAKRTILMSGTLAHSQWYDFDGLLAFLKRHPFETHEIFMHAFSKGTTWLQRFLQSVTIAAPEKAMLDLPPMMRQVSHTYPLEHRQLIIDHTTRYQRAAKSAVEVTDTTTKLDGAKDASKLAKIAEMFSLSLSLGAYSLEMSETETEAKDQNDDDTNTADTIDDVDETAVDPSTDSSLLGKETQLELNEIADSDNTAGHELWKRRLEKMDLKAFKKDSARFKCILELCKWAKTAYPGEKIVIFSAYPHFLDLIDKGFRSAGFGPAIRFDESAACDERDQIVADMEEDPDKNILLATAGTSRVGVEFEFASIVIITEPWWNWETIKSTYYRVRRIGDETKDLKIWQLKSNHSPMDLEIWKFGMRKPKINEELMGPLFVMPGNPPNLKPLPAISQKMPPADDQLPSGVERTEDPDSTLFSLDDSDQLMKHEDDQAVYKGNDSIDTRDN